jgi:hypothetical protein
MPNLRVVNPAVSHLEPPSPVNPTAPSLNPPPERMTHANPPAQVRHQSPVKQHGAIQARTHEPHGGAPKGRGKIVIQPINKRGGKTR